MLSWLGLDTAKQHVWGGPEQPFLNVVFVPCILCHGHNLSATSVDSNRSCVYMADALLVAATSEASTV
jgi:hypothetical protein